MRKVHSGQALLLVLVSLAVVLTLVLFVLARSTTDIAISSRSEEATRAFSAAEAGIENALVVGAGSGTADNPVLIGGNATYFSSISPVSEGETEYVPRFLLKSGESTSVWFVSHNSDGSINVNDKVFQGNSINICWGDGILAGQEIPAIEISIFYEQVPGNPASIRIYRAAFDPLGSSLRDNPNSFSSANAGGCAISGFAYSQNITFSDPGVDVNNTGLLFARIRVLYNSLPQPIGISVSGGLLPSQGQDISSTGSTLTGVANRKINVFQGWPEPPEVFDYAIYSGTGLTK